jgi:hypothetical protein
LKLLLEADNVIDGERPETVKVMLIVLGLLLATFDSTLIIAVYVPGVNVPVSACNVIVAGAVVVFSDTVNQTLPGLRLIDVIVVESPVNEPPPPFVTFTV